MDGKTRSAIEQVKRLAIGYQAVIDVFAALEAIGDLEAAHDEAQRKLARSREDLERAGQDLSAARSELARAVDEAAHTRSACDQAANRIKESAKSEARAIGEEATLQAERIVSEANAKAESIVSSARQTAMEASERDAREASTRRAVLDELQAKIDQATGKLAAQNSELEKVEQRIASITEGVKALAKDTS